MSQLQRRPYQRRNEKALAKIRKLIDDRDIPEDQLRQFFLEGKGIIVEQSTGKELLKMIGVCHCCGRSIIHDIEKDKRIETDIQFLPKCKYYPRNKDKKCHWDGRCQGFDKWLERHKKD